MVHAELLPVFALSVPTKVGLEVDDPDGIGTDVNEVNDSGDGDLLTVNSEWQIRILLNSQLTIERVYERLDVTFIVVRGLDILFQDVPLSELVSPRSERCPSPVIDVPNTSSRMSVCGE